MLLGIDVGGTFTDAVIIADGKVFAQAKTATVHENVLQGILRALDMVLQGNDSQITRVVISSTIVTNALTEHQLDPVFLAVIAGPGMNVKNKFPVQPYEVSGYVDHRGKVTAQIDWSKHTDLLNTKGKGAAAVSGKFAVRDPKLELELAKCLRKNGYDPVFCASELNGELNFIRRTNSAYFAAATYKLFNEFAKDILQALTQRKINAPVYILKADGGTLPLNEAMRQPVEAVFTGPAASVLGIEALVAPVLPAISLDVGGTTTDIAFWENGHPLMAKHGAVIDGFPTAVRTFHMRSIGIGGDSQVIKQSDGTYRVGPQRIGKAVAVGGKEVTLSDALITCGLVHFGDEQAACEAVGKFGEARVEAEKIVGNAVQQIMGTIDSMLAEWAKQPVYTVEDVIKGTEFKPEVLVGVGGGAPGLIKALGEKMRLPVDIPTGGMVANAIGAALSRPTLSAALRADTTDGYYIIPESGRKEKLPSNFGRKKAEQVLKEYLQQKTAEWNLPDQDVELVAYEFFNTIHGYYDSGEIFNLRMQLKPGILHKLTVVDKELNIDGQEQTL
ncbi:MAG: hydantoinase/oxoprolinase family protein [Phascolarctobacterium sp.]|nr:hydantoinase/oxoprolinase family protein [Candidatus Phascolarctobacterium caballi]